MIFYFLIAHRENLSLTSINARMFRHILMLPIDIPLVSTVLLIASLGEAPRSRCQEAAARNPPTAVLPSEVAVVEQRRLNARAYVIRSRAIAQELRISGAQALASQEADELLDKLGPLAV